MQPYYDSNSNGNPRRPYCRFFDRGICNKGDQCPMLHVERQPSVRQYPQGPQQSDRQPQGTPQRFNQPSGQFQQNSSQVHQVRPSPQHQGQQFQHFNNNGPSQQNNTSSHQHYSSQQNAHPPSQHNQSRSPQSQSSRPQQLSIQAQGQGQRPQQIQSNNPQSQIQGSSHPQRCRFFDRGNCTKGDQCHMLHITDIKPPHQQQGQQFNNRPPTHQPQHHQHPTLQPSKPIRCRFYDRGNCHKGDQCPLLHIPENSGRPLSHNNQGGYHQHPYQQPRPHYNNNYYNNNRNYNNGRMWYENPKHAAFLRNKTELSLIRKKLPETFPRGAAFTCWKYIVPGPKNQRCTDISGECPNGVHDENLREEFVNSQRSKVGPLINTEPGTSHPNFRVNCVCCDRLLVRGENVHRVYKNCIWATSLEHNNIFISPLIVNHPIKLHNTQSVFCLCSRWIGDYLEDYKCEETGKKVEYKVEVINKSGETTNSWSGNQEGHILAGDKPHSKQWTSEKHEVEDILQ